MNKTPALDVNKDAPGRTYAPGRTWTHMDVNKATDLAVNQTL